MIHTVEGSWIRKVFKRIGAVLNKIDNNTWYQYGLLALVTLLAAVLRFYKLGAWSFWIDEVFTVNRTTVHYGDLESIISTSIRHKFLPLSIILSSVPLNFWGTSEWSARFVPALFGILSVPVFYFPTKKIFGWRVSLLAVLLLAISIWHIEWSQNARFYTALLFFYTLALFAFYFAFERDRPLYIFLGYFLTYLAFSERFLAFWIAPVIACYLILLWKGPFGKPAGFRMRNVLLLIFLPILGVAIIEIFSLATSGSPRFLTESFFADFVGFTSPKGDPVRLFFHFAFNMSFPVICIGFCGGLYLVARRNRAGLFFLITALVPVILLVMLNPFVFTKDRYVFITLFSWLVLTAAAINELITITKNDSKILSASLLLLLAASAAGSSLLYYGLNNGNRRDWRSALAVVEEQAGEDDIVVGYWPEIIEYYLDKEGTAWRDIHLETMINADERYWFVLDSESVWANWDMYTWVLENTELIFVHYLRVPGDMSLRVYLYDPQRQDP